IGGVPTQPFSMATLPSLGTPNAKLSSALKQLSAAKFGRPKAMVETEIFKRMETKQLPPSPAAAGIPTGFGTSPAPAQAWPAASAGMAPRVGGGVPAGAPSSPPPKPSGSF